MVCYLCSQNFELLDIKKRTPAHCNASQMIVGRSATAHHTTHEIWNSIECRVCWLCKNGLQLMFCIITACPFYWTYLPAAANSKTWLSNVAKYWSERTCKNSANQSWRLQTSRPRDNTSKWRLDTFSMLQVWQKMQSHLHTRVATCCNQFRADFPAGTRVVIHFLNIGTKTFGPGFSGFASRFFIATLCATT